MKKVITLVTALTILFGTMVAVPHNEKFANIITAEAAYSENTLVPIVSSIKSTQNTITVRIAGTRREPFLVLKEAMSLEIYLQTRSIIFACVLVPTRFGERIAIAIILQLALLLPPSVIARVVQLRQRLRGGRPMVHMAMRYK